MGSSSTAGISFNHSTTYIKATQVAVSKQGPYPAIGLGTILDSSGLLGLKTSDSWDPKEIRRSVWFKKMGSDSVSIFQSRLKLETLASV